MERLSAIIYRSSPFPLGGILCLLLLWLLTTVAGAAPPVRVDIVINGNSALHADFADNLSQQLRSASTQPLAIRLIDSAADTPTSLTESTNGLVVSVGTQATDWVLQHADQRPLLATLIPQQSYLALHAEYPVARANISAIYIDQPLARQVRLLSLLFPEADNISALLGPVSASQAEQLQTLLNRHGRTLNTATLAADDNPVPPLDRLLNQSDVFFALPDPAVFNRQSLTGILLTTYRHRVPVIGFSRAYVQAGALAAAYSTAEQIAQQTAEYVIASQTDQSLPPPTHSRYFSIAINDQVARALALELPDAVQLQQQLEQLEQDAP